MRYEESEIQITFIDWVNLQHPKLAPFVIHVPNGGRMTLMRGHRLKKMGVKRGAADILFMWRKEDFGGLWLEFKAANGVQSNPQKEFEQLCQIAHYDYQVVKSLDMAIDAFNEYMALP
jgi:hypothetical protein